PPSAALLCGFLADMVNRLAAGHGEHQPPEVVAVLKFVEASLGGPLAEAGEDAQGDVFLIVHPPRCRAELSLCNPRQFFRVPVPQAACCLGFAGLEATDPAADGIVAVLRSFSHHPATSER